MYRSVNVENGEEELRQHTLDRHCPPNSATSIPRGHHANDDHDNDDNHLMGFDDDYGDDFDRDDEDAPPILDGGFQENGRFDWHEVSSLKKHIVYRYPNQIGEEW